jgi:hypothetical protein
MNIPSNLKYTKSDEWFDPSSGNMGLSDYAQSQLSDIVFLEILVDVGDAILEAARSKGFGTIVTGRRGVNRSFFGGSVSYAVSRKLADAALWLVP